MFGWHFSRFAVPSGDQLSCEWDWKCWASDRCVSRKCYKTWHLEEMWNRVGWRISCELGEYNDDMDVLTGKGANMEKRIMMDYGVSGRQTVTDIKMFVLCKEQCYTKMNYILPFVAESKCNSSPRASRKRKCTQTPNSSFDLHKKTKKNSVWMFYIMSPGSIYMFNLHVLIFVIELHHTSSYTSSYAFQSMFSQVTADQLLPHHAPLGHRCLRLRRWCHHQGRRPCHHRCDLTRRTQLWCSRRLVFGWRCVKTMTKNIMLFFFMVWVYCGVLIILWSFFCWRLEVCKVFLWDRTRGVLMTISENGKRKEPKVPAILKTVNVVCLLFDEMHHLGTTFLTIPCQTWEGCKPHLLSIPRSFMYVNLHLVFVCFIRHWHVETSLPGQHFWKAQLILCHAGPVVTARQRSAVALPWWVWLSQIPSIAHPSQKKDTQQAIAVEWQVHITLVIYVFLSCPRVPLFQCLNLCKLRWNSMEFLYWKIHIFSFVNWGWMVYGRSHDPLAASVDWAWAAASARVFWRDFEWTSCPADIKSVSCNYRNYQDLSSTSSDSVFRSPTRLHFQRQVNVWVARRQASRRTLASDLDSATLPALPVLFQALLHRVLWHKAPGCWTVKWNNSQMLRHLTKCFFQKQHDEDVKGRIQLVSASVNALAW